MKKLKKSLIELNFKNHFCVYFEKRPLRINTKKRFLEILHFIVFLELLNQN